MFLHAIRAHAKRIERFVDGQPVSLPIIVRAILISTGSNGIFLYSLRQKTEKFDMFCGRAPGQMFHSCPASIFPRDVANILKTVFSIISKTFWGHLASILFTVKRARATSCVRKK